jgi:hypothetical protein
MAKVDGSLGSLVQGISQQPPRARLPGQSELQINVRNDEVNGMSRRNPSTITGTADSFTADAGGFNVSEHATLRSGTDLLTYALQASLTAPLLRVTKDAVNYTVTIPTANAAYFQTDPERVGDGHRMVFKEMDGKIYAVNTSKVVETLAGVPSATVQNATVVYVRGGQFAVGYEISFKLGAAHHRVAFGAPDGTTGSHTRKAKSAYVAEKLYALATNATVGTTIPSNGAAFTPADDSVNSTSGAGAAFVANFTTTLRGVHIIFTPTNPALDYEITAIDTAGDDLLVAVREDVDDITRLPIRAPIGMVVRVVGSSRTEDDYFLQWTDENETIGTLLDTASTWEEVTDPNQAYRLNPATLPHELYWDGAGYSVRELVWEDRGAGNNESNPMPKMVGETIRDVLDFQGRAVYLHGVYAQMSKTDEYENLFKQTATAGLDTDPINIRSTATDGDSLMVYGVQFNRDLVLFATNNAQFLINGRSTVTPDNASMVLTSEFEADLATRPQAVGENIMFLSYTGKYSSMHEMYLTGDQSTHARRTVSDHVPQYVRGQAVIFTANDGANTAIIVADDKRTVFVYEYLWQDDRRVQSAWSQWTYSAEVMLAHIELGILTVVVKTASGAFLSTDTTLYTQDDSALDFAVHLDWKQAHTLADTQTVSVIYSGTDVTALKVISKTGSSAGLALEVTGIVDTSVGSGPNTADITLRHAFTGNVVTGEVYSTRYIPTMPVIKDGDGVAITNAELTINDFHVTFEGTGPFTMTRVCAYEAVEDYWTLKYSGRKLGDPDFLLGSTPIDSDTVDFPFSENVLTSYLEIECTTHLPMTLTEIEWNGNVNNRSRRITNGR